MSDNEILQMLEQRDDHALVHVREQFGGLCFAVAQKILGSSRDAEECVNDMLLRLWNSVPPAQPQSLKAYLTAVTRNLALDRLSAETAEKRGGTEVPLVLEELSEVLSGGQDVALQAEQNELRCAIFAFLKKQSAAARTIFIQRYYYCLSCAEIAQEQQIPENRVLVSLHRTRKKLGEYLRKENLL